MAIDTIISDIKVDTGADNGKVPVYNSTSKSFDMTFGDTVHAEAVATDVSINSVTAVTVLSKALTWIAEWDIVEVEISGNILNNSWGTRTYIHTFTLWATTFTLTDWAIVSASAITKATHEIKFRFAIISTSSIHFNTWVSRWVQHVAGIRQAIATTTISHLFNTSANNETGNKTLVYACHWQNATATQTFELRTFKVSLIKKKP